MIYLRSPRPRPGTGTGTGTGSVTATGTTTGIGNVGLFPIHLSLTAWPSRRCEPPVPHASCWVVSPSAIRPTPGRLNQ